MKGDLNLNQKECYRHELKYEIGYENYLLLKKRLSCVMKPDAHTGTDGCYRIYSIYFDNMEDKALREKINGVSGREKFRIRYYNNDFSYIKLEKKRKDNHLCRKYAATLTEEECRNLLDGKTKWMSGQDSFLVRDLYAKMQYERLKPRIMVSYLREPYVYPAGNVRVTFDSDIRTSLYEPLSLGMGAYNISAADTPQTMILEVKYDEFLPDIIAILLQTDGICRQAFSKYGISRRFG